MSLLRFIALVTEYDPTRMTARAVLPKEDTLPGAKAEAAIHKGYDFCGTRERHFDMAGHIIGSFVGMGEMWVVFRNKTINEAFQVSARRRIGILHNHQTRAGMAAEHGHGALL